MLNRDKSAKQFKLNQLYSQEYSLTNVSNVTNNKLNNSLSSGNLLSPSSTNNPTYLNASLSSFAMTQTNKLIQPNNKQNNKYMHFHKQNMKQQQSSLIKSKQQLQKFTNKISTIAAQKYPQSSSIEIVKSHIEQTANQISYHIDKRINQSFTQMLNPTTMMSINHNQTLDAELIKEINLKQNSSTIGGGLSLIQGTKMLMNQYWEKQKLKKPSTPTLKKAHSQVKLNTTLQNESSLPKINQKAYNMIKNQQKIILGKVSKNQKLRQEMLKQKDQQLKQQFLSLKTEIIDYRIQNQSVQFLAFQKNNFKKWQDISFLLNCLEKFCQVYGIREGKIDLKRVLELVDSADKKQLLKEVFAQQLKPRGSSKRQSNANNHSVVFREFTSHQLLSCFDDAQRISEEHPHSKGIRYYGVKGKKRAIIKIQSHFRRYLCQRKLEQLKSLISKIILIQRKYRQFMNYNRTKKLILANQLKKIEQFNKMQEDFKENYRHREMTRRVKYEIHICSTGGSQWQRVSTENFNERQNVQLSKIYRIATKSTPLIQTRVIYIAPCELPQDIVNYYKKIFQFSSSSQSEQQNLYSDKLSIIWPQNVGKLPQTLSLTRKILYSRSTLNKIRRIIRNNYAYIVPSKPSVEYISLCTQLKLPIYCAQPQKLLYLQTQSGMKEFACCLKQFKDDSFGVLPYSSNIYNKISFINELTFLVFNYPNIKRWVLKIDNESNSRGLAHIDTSKILKQQLLSKIINNTAQQEKQLKQQIYNKLYQTVVEFKQQRIIPLCRQVYHNQQQYLNHFLANGGIIQAAINNFQTDLENHSFTVQIEPDQEWKFITSYYKITHKNKSLAAYFDVEATMQPPIQIKYLVKQLISRKMFGFFTFEFIRIPNLNNNNKNQPNFSPESNNQPNSQQINQQNSQQSNNKPSNLLYFNSIKCHLDQFSSASFLKDFLSKNTNVLYIPFLCHSSLKQLRIQTFFHLCRLENISFDIKRKIGNVFMFLNGLESGCMGLMSFNGVSKEETFEQVSDVLEFLSRKLNQGKLQSKQIPKQFMMIRNVVNGYLKRTKEKKLIKELRQSKSTTNMYRTYSKKELI